MAIGTEVLLVGAGLWLLGQGGKKVVEAAGQAAETLPQQAAKGTVAATDILAAPIADVLIAGAKATGLIDTRSQVVIADKSPIRDDIHRIAREVLAGDIVTFDEAASLRVAAEDCQKDPSFSKWMAFD